MKLRNRKVLYSVFIFLTIFSGIFVDKIITAILILVFFIMTYFDKEFRKGAPILSNNLLFVAIILDILFIAWLIRDNYLN